MSDLAILKLGARERALVLAGLKAAARSGLSPLIRDTATVDGAYPEPSADDWLNLFEAIENGMDHDGAADITEEVVAVVDLVDDVLAGKGIDAIRSALSDLADAVAGPIDTETDDDEEH